MGGHIKALIAALVIGQLALVAVDTGPVDAVGTRTFSGSVRTQAGTAIDGATVALADPMTGGELLTTVTDIDGAFEIAGIDDGTYAAFARPPGVQSPLWLGGTYGGDPMMEPLPTFTLDDTQPELVGQLFEFPTGGFTGILTEVGPVTDAFIETVNGPGDVSAFDTTDVDGRFDLSYLPAGTYRFRVDTGAEQSWYSPPFVTDGTTTTDLTELAIPTGTVTGTILVGTDPITTFVPGDGVELRDVNTGESFGTSIDEATGTFAFGRVADGQYLLSYYSMESDRRVYHPSASDETQATVITIEEGNRAVVADITLPDLKITGSVGDGTSGVADAQVTAYTTDSQMWVGNTSSGVDGSFTIGGLSAGSYKVSVTPPGGNTESWYLDAADFQAATVVTVDEATPEAILDPVVLPDGSFTGTVVADPTLLQDASLRFDNLDVGGSAFTSIDPTTGAFEVRYLRPGTYRIFLQQMTGDEIPTGGTYDTTDPTPLTLSVVAPEGVVDGTVSDANGPIDGMADYVQVTLRDVATDFERYADVDMNGYFRFDAVADGTYIVSVYVMNSGRTFYHPDASDPSGAAPITVEEGNRALDASITLPNRSISGTVTDGTNGIDDVQIVAYDENENDVAYADSGQDTSGAYTLSGLPDGTYRIAASAQGGSQQWYGGTDFWSATPVTVDATTPAVDMIDFVFSGGGFTGVLRQSGVELAYREVYIESLDFTTGVSVTTDENGVFTARFLPAGDYTISVYDGWSSIRIGDTYTSDGSTIVDLGSIDLPDNTITVRFLDGDTAVDGNQRYLDVQLIDLATRQSRYAGVDGSGQATFGSVPPGDYIVQYDDYGTDYMANSTGFAPGVAREADAQVVTIVGDGNDVVVDVTFPEGSITGTVLANGVAIDATQRPVRVVLRDRVSQDSRTTTALPDGTYRFDGLFDGAYEIYYSDLVTQTLRYYPGTADRASATIVTLDDTDRNLDGIDLPLVDTGSISGTALDADGNPTDGPIVLFRADTDAPVYDDMDFYVVEPTYPDPITGAFTLPIVAVGDYKVAARVTDLDGTADVFAPGTLGTASAGVVSVTAGAESTVTIDVPQRATISGRVLDGNGLPVEGVQVLQWVESPNVFSGGQEVLLATTNDQGIYTSPALLPRESVIEFRPDPFTGLRPSFYDGRVTRLAADPIIPLPGEALVNIDGVVGQPGSISGVVTDAGGNPVPAFVQLIAEGAETAFDWAGTTFQFDAQDGSYQFDNVPPGNWVVQVQGTGVAGGFTSKSPYATTYSGDVLHLADAVAVTIPSGGPAAGDVEIQEGQVIRGTVTDPAGDPLAGVTVQTFPFDETDPTFSFRSATTGSDGTYELRGLTPGELGVSYVIYGNASWLLGEYYPGVYTQAEAVPFVVPDIGTAIGDIDVQLEAAIPGFIEIVDENGDPVPTNSDGFASFFPGICPAPGTPENAFSVCSDGGQPQYGQSDGANGFYAWLPPGAFRLRTVGWNPMTSEVTDLTVFAGDRFDCVLSTGTGGISGCTVSTAAPAGTVAGRVTGPDGQPLAGIQVSLRPTMDSAAGGDITGIDGTYEIPAPEGTFKLYAMPTQDQFSPMNEVVMAEWYSTGTGLYTFNDFDAATDVTITQGANISPIDFLLEQATTGVVTLSGGEPPADAEVNVTLCPTPGVLATFSCVDPSTGDDTGQPFGLSPSADGTTWTTNYVLPGTYTIAATAYDPSTFTVEPISELGELTVAGNDSFVCDLPLIGTGGTAQCSVEPVVFPEPDTDGVDQTEENGVPSSSDVDGDGNGDGIADGEQDTVTSLVDPSITVDGTTTTTDYVTLEASSTTGETVTLSSVSLVEPDETDQMPVDAQTSLVTFTVNGPTPDPEAPPAEPLVARIELLLPQEANSYWKYDPTADTGSRWTDATSIATFGAPVTNADGITRWPVTLEIQDGSEFDEDRTINGTVVDPGRFGLDRTPPEVTCQAEKPRFVLNEVGATYTVEAEDPSGVIPESLSAVVDTSEPGYQSVLVPVTDQRGNTNTLTHCTYVVEAEFVPTSKYLDADTTVKGGRTVPVRWTLTDAAGDPVEDGLVTVTSVATRPVECATGESTGDAVAVDIDDDLITQTQGRGHLLWRTDKAWSGTCRTLEIRFSDDNTVPQVATFEFT